MYWIRAYQTYLQLGEFDEYFLLGKSRQGQIAAAQIAYDRVDGVRPIEQIQLGMQGVA